MPEPDLVYASMTQDAATIQRVLGGEFDNFEVQVLSTNGAEPETPETPPTEETPAGPTAGTTEQPTGTEAEPSAEAAPPAAPAEPEQPHKKPGSQKYKAQRDKALADLANANQEREELRRKLAESAGQPTPALTAPPAATAEQPEAEPQLNDLNEDGSPRYPDYADYAKAIARFTYRDERRKFDEAAKAQQAARQEEELNNRKQAHETEETQRWNSSVTQAKEEFPDFEQVMAKPRQRVIPPALMRAVADHDHGGKLAYLLETHPEVEERLAKLAALPQFPSERQVRLTFGRLHEALNQVETELAKPPAAAPPAQAPPAAPVTPPAPPPAPPKKHTPPSPIGSRGTPGYRTIKQMTDSELRDMSQDEYRKRRDAGE